MKFLDFFSGIGGFRLGMEMAGHECVGHCEIDKYADKSYRAMHKVKESEFYANDITRIIPEELPEADCYCGGFPCQSFSIAGKRGGFADTRGTLFFEGMRLAAIRKPKYLFLENVKGLLSHDGGTTFGTIIAAMGECGYDAEWQVLNSKNFGVPQNRERVFIIGHLRGTSGREIFPIEENDREVIELQGQYTNTLKARYEAIGDGSYIIESEQYAQGIKLNQVGTLDIPGRHESAILCLNTKDSDEIQPHQHERVYHQDGLLPALNAEIGGRNNVMVKEATQQEQVIRQTPRGYNSGGDHSICPTLTKNSWEHNNHLVDGFRIRKLTPKECFRLQGFPDEYFDRAKEVNSDSQLYKQAGNSVTVNVIFEIARRLYDTIHP